MEYALYESQVLTDNYVGTEHLLLALLSEPESVGGQIIKEMGVTREEILAHRGQQISQLKLNLPEEALNKICTIVSEYQAGKMPAITALSEIRRHSDELNLT
jgi:ATP-dependent Clp protease ATP-binding subunit ClpA